MKVRVINRGDWYIVQVKSLFSLFIWWTCYDYDCSGALVKMQSQSKNWAIDYAKELYQPKKPKPTTKVVWESE